MKRKYIWLIEIFIWLIIISVSLFFFIYKTTIKDNVQNTYYLFFDDADGLVKGSAVRLMGINIGYVRDIKIFDNKVFISFLVTKDNIEMPKHATATIEFYGLGGSTSLELHPAYNLNIENNDVIIPSGSYRIQDFWDGQELTANVMINIYGSIGRNINASGIMNHKDLLKQSAITKEFAMKTGMINTEQSVLIYKLTEKTLKQINNNEYGKLNSIENKEKTDE